MNAPSRIAVVVAACFGAAAYAVGNARLDADQSSEPRVAALPILTAATAKHFGLFQDIALSPDLGLTASSLCDDRRRASSTIQRASVAYFGGVGCDIQVLDLSTGVERTITPGGDNTFPVWSPDGRSLAFLSDIDGTNQLYVWNRESATTKRVSMIAVSAFSEVQWTPDSRNVVVMSSLPSAGAVASGPSTNILSGGPLVTGAGVTVYRSAEDLSASESAMRAKATTSSPSATLDYQRGNLELIEVASGNARELAANINMFDNLAIAPDGSALIYADERGYANETNNEDMISRIVLIDLPSLSSRVLARQRTPLLGSSFAWTPRSDKIAWFGGPVSPMQVSTYDRASRTLSAASTPATPNEYFSLTYQGRLVWNDSGSTYYFIGSYGKTGALPSDETAIYAGRAGESTIAQFLRIPEHAIHQVYLVAPRGGATAIAQTTNVETKRSGFYRVDLATGVYHQVYERQVDISDPTESADRSTIAYYKESADQSPDIWMSDMSFTSEKRLTHINPDFDRYVFGKAQMISWTTAAGQHLHGALMLPSDYRAGRRYPLIVYPYGSAYQSRNINHWGFGEEGSNPEDLQTLATRGYAILLPDAPVRTGSPMRDIALTIMPGVDKTIAMGIADPQRLGVMGHSYGGYTVMSLIAQTTRFKAAISRAGFSDWTAIYSELMSDGTAYGLAQADGNQYGLGGGPWTVRDRFISNSPYYLFDKVTTPVLIVQGTGDTAVAPYNADISFVALRHLHKDVALARYGGGDHTEGTWPFADQLDYMTRIVNWFDKYLCPNRPSETDCD